MQVNFGRTFWSKKLPPKRIFHLNMWIRSPQGVKDDSEKYGQVVIGFVILVENNVGQEGMDNKEPGAGDNNSSGIVHYLMSDHYLVHVG